ncbi:MAG: hypothetical protein J7647_02210 [Cyanobacteria bacterium SBLK]|nr:hypothetical protein [Cyanobacteria bacterium SBLK]
MLGKLTASSSFSNDRSGCGDGFSFSPPAIAAAPAPIATAPAIAAGKTEGVSLGGS